MTTTDDSAPKCPPDNGPLPDELLPAIAEAVRDRHGDATLLGLLFADPTTARLILAWRRSVITLEAVRAEAEARGEDTTWFVVNETHHREDL